MKRLPLFFCMLIYSLASFAQANLEQGLMAYYPFNGNASDMSGNNNNPSFNNGTLTADRFGNTKSAYHFNGRNNYMRIANAPSLNMNNKISISVWVKPTGYYNGTCVNNMLVMKGDDDYLDGNYSLRFADPYTGCSTPDLGKEMFYGAGGPVAAIPLVKLNQWYCVVWVCDGSTASIYVNGILRSSTQFKSTRFTNRYDLFLGHLNNAQYPYWLNGDLDEVRIYNRAISPAEVSLLCDVKQTPVVPEPSIDFNYAITNCNAVQFKISKSENIKSYKWDLGDMATAAKESFTHLYKKDGSYAVKLIATGSNGKEIIITKNFTITKPTAAFTYEAVTEKNTFNFNIDDKQKVKYKWLFGDGIVSDKDKRITHTYQQAGNYEASLIATNKNGCSDTATQIIIIKDLPATTPKDAIVTIPINTDSTTALVKQRENNLLKEIIVNNDSLSVTFYDNAEIDGDSVTIVYNNKIIITHLFLTDKPKTFILPVDTTGQPNELIMYAENLGSIPPNTALMVVYDGNIRHEISISSSKTSNGMVRFIFKR